jgi:acetyl-CoA acetyltransferase
MSYMELFKVPDPAPELSRKSAIVGVGESDFHADYQAARAKEPGYEGHTSESLAVIAFERALADSGLKREDIDGLGVNYLYGGPTAAETADMLGLKPKHIMGQSGGICAGPIPKACVDIAAGKADTIALIFSAATRSIGRKFGGQTFDHGAPSSYYYHHPWGWSSQAAHWALIWQHYMATYGATEADLASVATQLRNNAMRNPNAIMQAPLTTAKYLASRYVVRPLHLFDLCLVNDGAVCLIIRKADMAKGLTHVPVDVGGWGHAAVKSDKLHTLVRERLRPQFQESGRQALAMADIVLSDVQHFEGYDASTIHLINHIEGHGFVEPGAGLEFCKSGEMDVGGSLPVNMAGGILSGSYMHGWNHVAEIVRQLRHEAGPRQVKDVEVSMFSLAQTDQVHPVIFMRGEAS